MYMKSPYYDTLAWPSFRSRVYGITQRSTLSHHRYTHTPMIWTWLAGLPHPDLIAALARKLDRVLDLWYIPQVLGLPQSRILLKSGKLIYSYAGLPGVLRSLVAINSQVIRLPVAIIMTLTSYGV